MKKIITLLVFIVTSSVYAQNSGITYQAVIYNPSSEILPGNNNPNVVLAAKDICLRFSIIDVNTNLEYQEVQKVKTDEFGMVNLIVGEGDQVSGYATDFDAIIWSSSNKYLKVEIDTNGNCTNFIEISNQKFSAVPFAYASKVAETVSGIVPIVNGGTGADTVAGAKTNLGLNNVDNTSDLNKPVSTATQTALDAKAPLASPGFTGIPTAPTAAAGTSTTQIATTAFVNAALATAAAPDATTTLKGRIQLAGDLAGTGSSAASPVITNNAITTVKINNGAVTPAKIEKGSNNTVLVTDATGNVAWVDRASFGAVADMTTIEGAGTTANPFKVKDLGIITAKLANEAVTTPKLADAAVVPSKIAPGANNTVLVTNATGAVAWSSSNSIMNIREVIYTANANDNQFTTPLIFSDINKVHVFRNGVRIGLISLDSNHIQLEAGVICDLNDEIRIVQYD